MIIERVVCLLANKLSAAVQGPVAQNQVSLTLGVMGQIAPFAPLWAALH